jgi:hypothetical protein
VLSAGIGFKIMLLSRRWAQSHKAPSAPPQPPSAETFDYQDSAARPVTSPPATAPLSAPAAIAGEPLRAAGLPVAKPAALQPVALHVDIGAKDKVSFDLRTPIPGVMRPEPAPSSPAATEPPAVTAAPSQQRPAPKHRPAVTRAGDSLFPPTEEALVVEQGRLGKLKVPALLKRCADLPQPVILRVRTRENETCVHFAAGQICHAYARDWRVSGETRQWSKLGYLMVREGMLAETQRDQALELIGRQEGLRLAAALQQLGILDLEALRHVLAKQAKTTLFALILFAAGEYRIEADSNAIPAEESIALQAEELIREAAHHQAEWTAIRKVLPSLDTLLDFSPEGRDKLDQVRLSVHQQLLLSQVDGQTPVGTLCNASTMMDYEVCRFLYLMVKAGVLQAVPAS